VALAAAVEDRLDGLCADNITRPLCSLPNADRVEAVPEGAVAAVRDVWWHDEGGRGACEKAAKSACRGLVEEHADGLVRATLDNKSLAFCGKLRGCDVSRSEQLKAVGAAVEPTAAAELPENFESDPATVKQAVKKLKTIKDVVGPDKDEV